MRALLANVNTSRQSSLANVLLVTATGAGVAAGRGSGALFGAAPEAAAYHRSSERSRGPAARLQGRSQTLRRANWIQL